MGLLIDYLGKKSPFIKKHGKKIILLNDILWFFAYVYLLLHARDILLNECEIFQADLVCYPKANFTENGLPVGIYINLSHGNLVNQSNS